MDYGSQLLFVGLGLFSMFTAFKHINVYMCCFLLQFLLVLSVNLFCCVSVLWALKKPGAGERGKERKEENHMKRRAFYLILITTVTMVTMFVPVIIRTFLFFILSQEVLIFTSLSFMFQSGWFCAACSLCPPGWKTALPLLELKHLKCNSFFFLFFFTNYTDFLAVWIFMLSFNK